jgi:alkylhydroperoxidase family enzyme
LLNVLARSPAALAGYLGLHQGLVQGRLSMAERSLIGLMVAQRSGSAYWLSVQSRLAEKAGLARDQIQAAREGCADTDRQTALLFLAGRLVINRGELAEADIAAVRQAGLSDIEITEVILHVGLNLTAAAIGHAAALELDFPPAPPLPAF